VGRLPSVAGLHRFSSAAQLDGEVLATGDRATCPRIGWQILSAAAVFGSVRSSALIAACASVDVIGTPWSDMQLLNAAKVAALIVLPPPRPPPNPPEGRRLAHAAKAADALGLPLASGPPKPPGPREPVARGGWLKLPVGRGRPLPLGRARGEKLGTATPCACRHAVYCAKFAAAVVPRDSGAPLLVAELTVGLTGGTEAVVAVLEPPLHAATTKPTASPQATMPNLDLR
jgi:hypothetical protein